MVQSRSNRLITVEFATFGESSAGRYENVAFPAENQYLSVPTPHQPPPYVEGPTMYVYLLHGFFHAGHCVRLRYCLSFVSSFYGSVLFLLLLIINCCIVHKHCFSFIDCVFCDYFCLSTLAWQLNNACLQPSLGTE